MRPAATTTVAVADAPTIDWKSTKKEKDEINRILVNKDKMIKQRRIMLYILLLADCCLVFAT